MLRRLLILSLWVNITTISSVNAKPVALYDFIKPPSSLITMNGVAKQTEKNQQGEVLRRLTFSNQLANPQFEISPQTIR